MTDREWTWEFLRRRPDYREAWEKWKTGAVTASAGVNSAGEAMSDVTFARTDDPDTTHLRFGVSVIYDPWPRMSEDHLWMVSFFGMVNHQVWDDPFFAICALESEGAMAQASERLRKKAEAKRAAGLIDYRFNLGLPLEPQIRKARDHLLRVQAGMYGKKTTHRHRRGNWPLFLRALDARDCDATYALMAATFWPRAVKTEQSARDTYKRAIELRDNSRINSAYL